MPAINYTRSSDGTCDIRCGGDDPDEYDLAETCGGSNSLEVFKSDGIDGKGDTKAEGVVTVRCKTLFHSGHCMVPTVQYIIFIEKQ